MRHHKSKHKSGGRVGTYLEYVYNIQIPYTVTLGSVHTIISMSARKVVDLDVRCLVFFCRS